MSERAERAAERGEEFRFVSIVGLEALVGRGTRLYFTGLQLSPGAARPTDEIPTVAAERLDYDLLGEQGLQRMDFTVPEIEARREASAAPVRLGGEIVGAILLTRRPGEFGTPLWTVASRAIVAAAIGLGVALAILLFLTGRVTRPLNALRGATRRVAAGDLHAQVAPSGIPDIDEVSTGFNAMVRQLARREQTTRDFLMRVTHDLRTPLTAIRGHASALADGVVPERDVPRSMAAIEGEAVRLEALVSDLLDLARIDADRFRLELSDVEAAEVLDQAFDAFEAEAATRGVRYERDIEPLPVVTTDGVRVGQIVGNLLDNALRWTPAGGTVRLTGRVLRGGGFTAQVSDSGPGIAADEIDAVFEAFRSQETPDGRRGSGLGLAISRQLARALGGELSVESREGRGSTFTLELPAAAAPDRVRAPVGPSG